MRKRLYEIISASHEGNIYSRIYDYFKIVIIIISLVPVVTESNHYVFEITDIIAVTVFILDYICRLITADYKLKYKHGLSFVLYPFTPMAIIDLLSILPSLDLLGKGFKMLKIVRLVHSLRVVRVFEFIRYSEYFSAIFKVFKK